MSEIIGWCCSYLHAFKDAQFRNLRPHKPNHEEVWKPPPWGIIKVNVDAAFPPSKYFYNISLVSRNSDGQCIWWKIRKVFGQIRPVDGEANAVLQAITTARTLHWRNIIVEGDCVEVIDALREKTRTFKSFRAVLDECFSLSSFFSVCSFSFFKRPCNRLAHDLASISVTDYLKESSISSNLAMSA
ncbi:PREDICTED: uncharacterized protein LOC105969246 [Erythranthe guttata]|uniref:uncharacterized protein LOC105969246 n=1 Tax=Erythranthe guttata TaxID=4155 RepID=UPI00064DDAE1|nr:PREDICTED: uncharacterized protein LOC105969246 [Erythranthe guttata]|eukprot:XP_012849448.1 PREDICTED: uncharacterized protein LOC105969246 [Erythranthe guttata]